MTCNSRYHIGTPYVTMYQIKWKFRNMIMKGKRKSFMLGQRTNFTDFIRDRIEIRKYIFQNGNLSIRGMPKFRMPYRNRDFDIIDNMRFI